MARGDLFLFDSFADNIANGTHDLNVDTFAIMLVNNSLVPTQAQVTPDSTDFTEVVATGSPLSYIPGGEVSATTFGPNTNGVSNFDLANVAWAQDLVGGPTDIYYGIIYNQTYTGSPILGDAIGYIDMTADSGTTPVSLQAGAIAINIPSGIFNITVPS